MGSKINLTGERFGRLTVVRETTKSSCGSIRWECICDCGKAHIVYSCHLRSGHTKSCGCLYVETAIKTFTTHGKSNTPEHVCWMDMVSRCYSKNNQSYHRYGGRGITVCKRWRNNFINFLNDMGLKPNPKLTIERIDNDGDYRPGNCKWETHAIQNRNKSKRKDNNSGTNGVSWDKSKSKWLSTIGLDHKQKFIGRFSNLQDAITARKQAEHVYWGI